MERTNLICGLDEVGRGSLAGPIIAVAALFNGWDPNVQGVGDSKKLSAKKRAALFPQICRSPTLIDFGIGLCTAQEIDDKGIEWANARIFERALSYLPRTPSCLIVDGVKRVAGWKTEQKVVPKADQIYPVVGAASILAKVIRDTLMKELGQIFPQYHWNSNAGYGSKAHRTAIAEYGPCPYHRTRFIRSSIAHLPG